MASKSKKRRRVLGASCILAALIIAGSSFAWFTSSDEVTNRLSANADYGVKIVESFAPPANWLPGQKVNKDVYATNTGTVEAFVKETISGVLTINNEKAVASASGEPTANSKELTEEERYAVEAGAFLAYKPAGDTKYELGDQIVTRPADQPTGTGAHKVYDFTPATEGLYVFRRSIDVNNDKTGTVSASTESAVTPVDTTHTADDYGAESFTYDAYYFVPAKDASGTDPAVPAKYYKVSNLIVTEDNVPDFAGDGKKTDGIASAATVDYGFYEDVTDVVKNVDLTYRNFADTTDDKKELKAAGLLDASGNEITGQYLIATYDTGTVTGVDLNADFKAAADNLDVARHEYELALEAQAAAAAESAAADGTLNSRATALDTAKETLISALNTQAEKAQDLATKTAAYDALLKEKTDLEARQDALELAMYGKDNGTESDNLSTSLYANSQKALTPYSDAHTELDNETTAVLGKALADCTYDDLKDFRPTGSQEEHDYYNEYVAKLLAQEQYTALKAEYDANKARLTAIGDGTSDNKLLKAALDAKNSAKDTKDGADTAVTTAQSGYDTAYGNFRDAVSTSNTKTTNLDTADARLASARTKWMEALKKFNKLEASHAAYSDGTLKIYIKLDDVNVIIANDGLSETKWQMVPAPVYKDKEAVFYYTGLLEGGETSTKLVDFVALDARTTQNMYKNFDFDLNVDLDSVQATQDENGRYVATSANDHFGADDDADIDGANVVIKTPTDVNTPLVWNFDAHA